MPIRNRTRRRSFWDYKPIRNPNGHDYGYDGCMLETFGDDIATIRAADPHHIWTLLDDGSVVAGWHYVNRFGYFITEHPWENENIGYGRV